MSEIPQGDVNWPGYHLPDTIDPKDYYCFEIHVPKDPWHVAAFLGTLHDLTNWFNWQRDTAKRGKDAATVWRNIWVNLRPKDCTPQPCLSGIEQEDFMPLRVDCNCNVFVTCCDGTEKQILTADQVKALIAGPQQNGAPQPQPGGGCQPYNITINGGQLQLIPTIVSTGDTIEIMSATGASTQDGLDWQCPDGEIYFAGACVGGGITDASAYVPTANIGKPVLFLNGSYYDLVIGTPFTVPSGITNKAPMLILNYVPSNTVSGQVECNVQVCNNAVARFTHHFNLRTAPGPFIIDDQGGNSNAAWTPGTGYTASTIGTIVTGDGAIALVCNNHHNLANCTLRVVGSCTDPSGGNAQHLFQQIGDYPPRNEGENYSATQSPSVDFSATFTATLQQFQCWIQAGPTDGDTATITDVYVTADGVDPF